MLVTFAFSILILTVLAVFVGGVVMAVRRLAFVAQAYRVQGQVVSEWQYRQRGLLQRFYRVEFQLRNGQRAGLRGSGWRPAVGSQVAVLVRERPGHDPKAKIASWSELWSDVVVTVSVGSMGLLMMALMTQVQPR